MQPTNQSVGSGTTSLYGLGYSPLIHFFDLNVKTLLSKPLISFYSPGGDRTSPAWDPVSP